MTDCIRRPHTVWTTCPCEPCTLDRNRKSKLHRAGLYNRIPSSDAWAVLDRLIALGWTAPAIASAAGIARTTIEPHVGRRRRTGHRGLIGPRNARLIVNHGDPTEGSVGTTGTMRRLRGLARQGYDLYLLEDMTGIGFSTLAAIRGGSTNLCRATYYVTIRDITAKIGMTTGPSRLSMMHAVRKDWPGLLAWDDIDAPDEKPKGLAPARYRGRDQVDEVIVQRVIAGEQLHTTRAEKQEVRRRWVEAGRSINELEKMTGWNAARYKTDVA